MCVFFCLFFLLAAKVHVEICAQLDAFQDLFGCIPVHADGHQHVHVLAGIRNVFSSALLAYSVTWTRLPAELHINESVWLDEARREFYADVVQDSVDSREVFSGSHVQFTEYFIGMATMGADMSTERLMAALNACLTDDGFCFPQTHLLSAASPNACTSEVSVSSWSTRTGGCSSHCPSANPPPLTCPHGEIIQNGVSICSSARNGSIKTEAICLPAQQECVSEELRISCSATHTNSTALPHISAAQMCRRRTVEVMVHPGYATAIDDGGCGQGPDDFAQSNDRDHEVSILTSRNLKMELEKKEMTLVRRSSFVTGTVS